MVCVFGLKQQTFFLANIKYSEKVYLFVVSSLFFLTSLFIHFWEIRCCFALFRFAFLCFSLLWKIKKQRKQDTRKAFWAVASFLKHTFFFSETHRWNYGLLEEKNPKRSSGSSFGVLFFEKPEEQQSGSSSNTRTAGSGSPQEEEPQKKNRSAFLFLSRAFFKKEDGVLKNQKNPRKPWFVSETAERFFSEKNNRTERFFSEKNNRKQRFLGFFEKQDEQQSGSSANNTSRCVSEEPQEPLFSVVQDALLLNDWTTPLVSEKKQNRRTPVSSFFFT